MLVSTHNLDEAERLADRVAVLHTRLLALDRPAALRQRLTTGRLHRPGQRRSRRVSRAGPRASTPAPSIDGSTLALTLPELERDTPALVRALVEAGADVLEIRPEMPALEDVYLHLMSDEPPATADDATVMPAPRAAREGAAGAVASNRAVLLPVVDRPRSSRWCCRSSSRSSIPASTGRAARRATSSARAKSASRSVAHERPVARTARVQLFLFQQFLIVFLLMPVTGAMALAAHAIVGEKQARTLEPLLATPITTFELLVAKVLGALLPTLAISIVGFALYVAGIASLAEPGVAAGDAQRRDADPRLLVSVRCARWCRCRSAIVVSSRVNDARTAQQFGALIIIPITGLLIAQFTGAVWLTATMMAMIAAGLLVVWVLLTLLSVAMFDREAILTRWR